MNDASLCERCMCMHPTGPCEDHACVPLPEMARVGGTPRKPKKAKKATCGNARREGCGARILMMKVTRKDGSAGWMPLDPKTRYIVKDAAGHVAGFDATGKFVRGNEVAEGDHETVVWESHFSTCPMASGFRNRR